MMTVILFVLFQIVAYIAWSWDDNNHRAGITQQGAQGGPPIATSRRISAIDYSFGWDSVEPKNNEWDFSNMEKTLDSFIQQQPNISFIFMPTTGNVAPHWLYDPPVNVPEVWVNTTNTQGSGPWPYYLNENYTTYFKRFQAKIYNYIINSKYYPQHIFVSQVMFGSTGDDTPWHGTPINSSYDISEKQWWDYEKSVGTYIYDLYYKSTPNTSPELLLLFNWGSNVTKTQYCTENWPGSYRKNGQASHGYQLNEEYNDWVSVGNLSRNLVQNNISIRFRGESNTDNEQAGGWWKEAPYWNTFTLLQWSLTYGVDFQGFSSGQIDNTSYDVQFDFFNLFDKYKHNYNDPQAAFIALRDGLDSNDTERFPESIFGSADINNQDRMEKIAQNMSEYGAKQEDPSHATGGPMNQRKAKKMNDVGFGIWRTNYAKFITQINPQNTSKGLWRIGDMNDKTQIYGRFARSFDHKSGKNTICFVLDKNLFGGLPLSKSVNLYFNVTYFDEGNGAWSFEYDAQNDKNKMGVNVKKTDKNKWLIKNFNINDAYFGQRGKMNSDFCLFQNDTDDTIFSYIQVILN